MSWRPKDWHTILLQEVQKIPNEGDMVIALMRYSEAGADAMLEALKEDGVFTYGCHTPDINLGNAPNESGYWVFIPEEE
jgi:hypothetical protein